MYPEQMQSDQPNTRQDWDQLSELGFALPLGNLMSSSRESEDVEWKM